MTGGRRVDQPWSRARAAALLAAAHPEPSAAVTVMAVLLGLAEGLPAPTMLLLALAVGAGQLSIGWLNDWVDAPADAVARRDDKPIVVGGVGRATVARAAALAAVTCVAASALLGRGGAIHLVAVASAWVYDVGVKSTPASVVPYALSFGLLPAVASWAAPDPGWPPWWVTLAAVALGVGGHLANALPDLRADRRLRSRSLPVLLGADRTLLVATGSLALGAATVAIGSPGAPTAALLGTATVLLAGVVAAARAERERLAFRLVVALAVVVVAGLVWPGR